MLQRVAFSDIARGFPTLAVKLYTWSYVGSSNEAAKLIFSFEIVLCDT